MPSLKFLEQSLLELPYQLHKVKGDRHTDRLTDQQTYAKKYAPPSLKGGIKMMSEIGIDVHILYTALNSPSLIFALWRSEADSPSLELAHTPVFLYDPYTYTPLFNKPSFKFALRSEGVNKTGRNFPCIQYAHYDSRLVYPELQIIFEPNAYLPPSFDLMLIFKISTGIFTQCIFRNAEKRKELLFWSPVSAFWCRFKYSFGSTLLLLVVLYCKQHLYNINAADHNAKETICNMLTNGRTDGHHLSF